MTKAPSNGVPSGPFTVPVTEAANGVPENRSRRFPRAASLLIDRMESPCRAIASRAKPAVTRDYTLDVLSIQRVTDVSLPWRANRSYLPIACTSPDTDIAGIRLDAPKRTVIYAVPDLPLG